jgi:GTP cyclohydrolase I
LAFALATTVFFPMTGVEKRNSAAVTSALLGVFRDDPALRNGFLQAVRTP